MITELTQNFKTTMFVIYQEDAGYRTTSYENGKSNRHVTNDIKTADMFKSKESALDHAIFTLKPTLAPDTILIVVPVDMYQQNYTKYVLNEDEKEYV